MYTRSACPTCSHTLAWYDLIPIFSWLLLRGHCRYCNAPISPLYPLIELFTACTLTALALFTPPPYFFAYFLLCSALIVTIRSDIEYMLISPFVSLYLVPFGFVLSAINMLPISLYASIVGAVGGYLFLYVVGKLFFWFTRKPGIGQGDLDLLALIGAFSGPAGCWASVLIGSVLGSSVGIVYLLVYKPTGQVKIPFGPFLALGSLTYLFVQTSSVRWLLY